MLAKLEYDIALLKKNAAAVIDRGQQHYSFLFPAIHAQYCYWGSVKTVFDAPSRQWCLQSCDYVTDSRNP